MSINSNFSNLIQTKTQAESTFSAQNNVISEDSKKAEDSQGKAQQNTNVVKEDVLQYLSAIGIVNNININKNGKTLATSATTKKATSDGGYIKTITSGKTTTTQKFNNKNLLVEYSFQNPNGVSTEWKHNDKGQETYFKTTNAKGVVTYEKKSLSSSNALQYYAVRRNANGKLTSSIMTNSKGVIVGNVAYAANQITLRYGNITTVINGLDSILSSGKEVTSDVITKLNEYANSLTGGKAPTKAQKESIRTKLNSLLNETKNTSTKTSTKSSVIKTTGTTTTKATTSTKSTSSTDSTKSTKSTKSTSTTDSTKSTTSTKSTSSTTGTSSTDLIKSNAAKSIQDAKFAKSVEIIAKKLGNSRLKACFMDAMLYIDEVSRKGPNTTAKDDSNLELNKNAANTFKNYINKYCNSIGIVITAETWCSGYYKNNKAYITKQIFDNKKDITVSQLILHELAHGMLDHLSGYSKYDESVSCLFESSYSAYANNKKSTQTVSGLCSNLRKNAYYKTTLPANLQIKKFCAA